MKSVGSSVNAQSGMSEALHKPRLVVLGTGFAGFRLVLDIDTSLYDVTVISPRNHFLFTPLLASTTVGTIEFRSIIEPIRTARPGVQYYQAACIGLDMVTQRVTCEGAIVKEIFDVPYDRLVIAVGAVTNTFGIPGVDQYCMFLKETPDARKIRMRVIDCFELASTPGITAAEQQRLLHFVVVGGGPTGVEFAAEMHDFLTQDLHKWYPDLTGQVRITLLEASNKILNSFDARLGDYTMKLFRRQKIDVRTGSLVKQVQERAVILQDGTAVPYGLVVWSTGIGPTSFIKELNLPKNNQSRLVLDPYLLVKGQANIYGAGDCVSVEGKNFPATGQLAQQEGKYLARALNRRAKGKTVKPFTFHNMGMLAYVGSGRALADLPAVKGRGFLAFLVWRSVYMTKLVSFKNKILVLFDWFKAAIFGRDISRF